MVSTIGASKPQRKSRALRPGDATTKEDVRALLRVRAGAPSPCGQQARFHPPCPYGLRRGPIPSPLYQLSVICPAAPDTRQMEPMPSRRHKAAAPCGEYSRLRTRKSPGTETGASWDAGGWVWIEWRSASQTPCARGEGSREAADPTPMR